MKCLCSLHRKGTAMNIIELFNSFKTQEQCVEYLERVRWHGEPVCPYCKSEKVSRHASGDRAQTRWQCQECSRAFAVTVGTIFHGTHVPLRNWFLVLALMLNAKKSASAYQIARDLGMRRPTVWSMMHRVRTAMAADPSQRALLHGVVEMDETYLGGKPRKGGPKGGAGSDGKSKRGRGTKKLPVVGAVERHGRVVAAPFDGRKLTAKNLIGFVKKHVDSRGSLLITDEFAAYNSASRAILHATVNHQKEYVADGSVHTNTIEGFWALLKRALYGQHHHYSRKYAPLYVAEACYKFNQRKEDCAFGKTLAVMVGA